MSSNRDLILITHDQLRQEIEGIPALADLARNGSSYKLDNLLQEAKKPNFPEQGRKYLSAMIVLKAEEEAPIGYEKALLVINVFLELCNMLAIKPNELFNPVKSMLMSDILESETMDKIFEWGKLITLLKTREIDVTELETVLDISYSPLIFDVATNTSKESNMDGLKHLVKANKLKIDSTGALQAIASNALSWIETNNDFYETNAFQNIATQRDEEATKDMNGLLELIEIDDADMTSRKQELSKKYGANKISVVYLDEEKAATVEFVNNPNFTVSTSFDSITSRDQIDIPNDSLTVTNNLSKTIYTRLYRGKIRGTNTEIAVKKISATNSSDLEKYNLEVSIMRELSGKMDCFLQYYGSFKIQNDFYIVMEYVPETLMERLLKNTLTEMQMIQIAKRLIEGFSYMSEKRIYHRDIKPHNILITPNNLPKIIDFGITVFNENIDISVSQLVSNTKLIQGTFGYMSPEQKRAYLQHQEKKPVTQFNILKSDIFSLGLTFYQMATQEDVSKYELAENNQELLRKVQNISSDKLKKTIIKMVNSDPSLRSSFPELIAEIGGQTVTIVG